MLFQLVLVIGGAECPMPIFFKREDTFDKWVNHHYLTLAAMVEVLRNTKDFEIVKRRSK
jgi:hypothetical protein